jgi:hypothetical protein
MNKLKRLTWYVAGVAGMILVPTLAYLFITDTLYVNRPPTARTTTRERMDDTPFRKRNHGVCFAARGYRVHLALSARPHLMGRHRDLRARLGRQISPEATAASVKLTHHRRRSCT